MSWCDQEETVIDSRDLIDYESEKDVLMEIWNELSKIASSLNKMAVIQQHNSEIELRKR